MQLLFLLPSLAYAIAFAIQGNNPWMMVTSFLTTLLAVVVRWRTTKRAAPTEHTAFRIDGERIWLDDRRLPKSALLWSDAENRFVYEKVRASLSQESSVRSAYSNGEFEAGENSLDFILGFNEELVRRNLERDGPHAILVGPTGAGKTVLLRQLLSTLIRFSRIELNLLDFKGGTGLAEFKAHSISFATDHNVDEAAELLAGCVAELERRELSAAAHFEPWLLVIDELAHLLARIPKSIDALVAISARGRAFGMHLLVTNQNLVGVPRALLSNLRLRILVGDADPVDAAMLGQGVRSQSRLQSLEGFAVASVVSHHAALEQFYFALPVREPRPEPEPKAREPQLPPGSAGRRRASSGRGRGRHRQHRQRASPGSQLREHKAESRW
jgi:hypothetical protein